MSSSNLRLPRAQHVRVVRLVTVACTLFGLAVFVGVTVMEPSSEAMVAIFGVATVMLFGGFFGANAWAQSRLERRQGHLVERLGLEGERRRFEGSVDGEPVVVELRIEVGRSWDERTDTYREVRSIGETLIRVGRERSAPPASLRELGVTLDAGAWSWRGPKNVLDDPAVEPFVRRLVEG